MKKEVSVALIAMPASTIKLMQALKDKITQKDVELNAYSSLSPIDTADPDNHYFNALLWALKNRKNTNIKNIAITGPFGSGKSSILKAFQKKIHPKGFTFLNLSLATFKEEIDKTDKPVQHEALLLIELSILQQIFYHESDNKIPDSRFKKIKSFAYDNNGNVISDQNKKVSKITYYFNNRPSRVSLNDGFNSYIQYTYDAAGIKLNQYSYIYDNNSTSPTYQTYVTNSTDYVGSMVLLNGLVLTVNHSEGRITPPTYENIFSNPDAASLDGFNTTSGNVVAAWKTISGSTYVKAYNSQSTTNEGIFPINTTGGSSYTVKAGQTYLFKVLGYQTSGTSASLYVKTNLGDFIWPGASLPTGSINKNWASVSITVPTNATSISLGVKWNGTGSGDTIYIDKVSLYKNDFEYNYFIKDQVGSTRVVLQTNPGTQTYTATMEPSNLSTENSLFLNMSGANAAPMVASPGNHTPGGSYAVKLSGAYPVGPAKSIKVYPGDQINASAYSYFVNASGYNSTLASVAANAVTVFGGVAGAGEAGSIYQNVTNAYATGGVLAGHTGSTSYPSAYLNYILFDKDYNPITTVDPVTGLSRCGSVPISQTPNSVNQLSMSTITVSEIGYVYVYLSYENTNTNTGAEVYFDDFKISVQESPVIQVNNYYPFGMESYSWLRGGETNNVYTYQGKELIAQTGWHDFGSRMYYADLGRWFATDPQNQFASPYLAMGNTPMMGRDPNGEFFGLDDLVVMAVGFAVGTVSYGSTHNWKNWGRAFESGAFGALIAEGGYVTMGGGLAATQQSVNGTVSVGGVVSSSLTNWLGPTGLGSMNYAMQFAGLFAAITGANVAENADNIRKMSDKGAIEAIAGFEAVSAIQAGSQTDWAENHILSMPGVLKGTASDFAGAFISSGLKPFVGTGGYGFDYKSGLAAGFGQVASKISTNSVDLLGKLDSPNSTLYDVTHSEGLNPGRDWLDKFLYKVTPGAIVKEALGTWAGASVQNFFAKRMGWGSKTQKDSDWLNYGSTSIKDILSADNWGLEF